MYDQDYGCLIVQVTQFNESVSKELITNNEYLLFKSSRLRASDDQKWKFGIFVKTRLGPREGPRGPQGA